MEWAVVIFLKDAAIAATEALRRQCLNQGEKSKSVPAAAEALRESSAKRVQQPPPRRQMEQEDMGRS
jgi:hypothetical protein